MLGSVFTADIGKRHVLASNGELSPQANMKANKNFGCQRTVKDGFGRQFFDIPLIFRGFMDDFGRFGMLEWCRLRAPHLAPPQTVVVSIIIMNTRSFSHISLSLSATVCHNPRRSVGPNVGLTRHGEVDG
jgi:hypothetical protein